MTAIIDATTPRIRTFCGTVLAVAALSGALHAGNLPACRADVGGCEQEATGLSRSRAPHRPALCGSITRMAVDYLNDTIGPTAAFDLSASEWVAGRTAHFHLYAVTTPQSRYPYANVTFERRTTTVRAPAPQNGRELSGRLYYSDANHDPQWRYEPDGTTPEDRIVFLDFAYHCVAPASIHRTRFILTLRGTDRPPPPHSVASVMPLSGSATARPELAGAWQSPRVIPERGPRETRLRVTGTLRVSNDGQGDAGPTRLVLFLSADDTLGPEDQLLAFRDVPALPAGAATELEADYTMPAPVLVGPLHLIALLDSSNTEREVNEQDNQVASRPLVR